MKFSQTKLKNIILALTAILCVAVFVLIFTLSSNGVITINAGKGRSAGDFLRVIDVGQGDSILICSKGETALVDTGPCEGSAELSEALLESGVEKIDLLILTHLHIDHTGGVPQIFEDFNVKNLVLPELSTFSEGIHNAQLAIDRVTRSGGEIYNASQGMEFNLGDFKITVLAAYKGFAEDNNRSLVLRAEGLGKRFLLTGDIEGEAELRLLWEKVDLRCDVLKIAHHGSSTSTALEFLKAADPKIGVISCGENNPYGHPHNSTLESLLNRRIKVYRTDKSGSVTFSVKKGEFTVDTEK